MTCIMLQTSLGTGKIALVSCFLKFSIVPDKMWFICSNSKCRRNMDLMASMISTDAAKCTTYNWFTSRSQGAAGVVHTTAASRCASNNCIFTSLTSKGSSWRKCFWFCLGCTKARNELLSHCLKGGSTHNSKYNRWTPELFLCICNLYSKIFPRLAHHSAKL